MKGRVFYFDLLKLFAIFLVLWGHCIAFLSNRGYETDVMYNVIYSFHMPLFMLVSGYFFRTSLKKDPLTVVKKKVRQLIIPCFTWAFIMFLVGLVARGKESTTLLTYISDNLWFLKSLFICCLFAMISSRFRGGYFITLFVSQFVAIYHFEIMYPCFLMGLYYSKVEHKISSKGCILACLVVWMTCIINWNPGILTTYNLSLSDIGYNFCVMQLRGFRVLAGISGGMFWLLLFREIFKADNLLYERVARLGSMTMGIYVYQSLIVERILPRIIQMDKVDDIAYDIIYTPTMSLLAMGVCVIMTYITKKSKIAGFLLIGETGK